jgi:hypothetical protein
VLLQVKMDGSDGRTDLRLSHPDSLAFYHRYTTKMDGSALYVGTSSPHIVEGILREDRK